MTGLPDGTVTLLFVDIEGSTQLAYQLGPEYGELLDEYRLLLRRNVSASGGTEIDCRADELFAAFARASDALTAACEIERAMRYQVWRDPRARVRVRVGLHTGEPVVRGGAYLGLDVHIAARVCAAGHGGQILLSQSTRDLVAANVDTRDLGLHELTGVPWAVRLFQVLGPELTAEFGPLRAASAEPRQRLSMPQRQRRVETPAAVATRLHALLPSVDPGLRAAFVGLGAALFVADRALTGARDLLARVNEKALARRLAAQRPMALHSARGAMHLQSLEAQALCLTTLTTRREELERCLSELPGKLAELHRRDEIERVREQVTALTEQLDTSFAAAVQVLDPLSYTRRRTRYRGVFRSGSRYVVPFYEESGREHQRTFETARAARDFRFLVHVAENPQGTYTDPIPPSAVGGGDI